MKKDTDKIYYIGVKCSCGYIVKKGTLSELINNVFAYEIACGLSGWTSMRINPNPKTIRGLIGTLNNCAIACSSSNRYYSLTEEEYNRRLN